MAKKLFSIFAAVLIFTGILFWAGLFSAQANLDEIILEDVPYFSSLADDGKNEQIYVVQKGDTLTAVAARFNVKIDLLAQANRLFNVNYIEAGQELFIPGEIIRHKVMPGETLTGIAGLYGVSINELIATNNLANENLLVAGQELVIKTDEGFSLPAWNSVFGLPVDELGWPAVGRISSNFGMRDGRPHEGLDIAAGEGEPIRAVRSGRVAFAGNRGTYGLTVIIDHGGGLTTLYGHASELLVQEGEWVREGQVVARVGSTGRSTGPHLHFEVRVNDVPYDPLVCLKRMYA